MARGSFAASWPVSVEEAAKPLRTGVVYCAETNSASISSVAEHLKAVVPFRGKLDGEPGFGPDGTANVAVFLQIAFG